MASVCNVCYCLAVGCRIPVNNPLQEILNAIWLQSVSLTTDRRLDKGFTFGKARAPHTQGQRMEVSNFDDASREEEKK